MTVERKVALKMWEGLYGKSIEAADFTGRKMNKSAYDQKNSKFGWTVTCLLPRSAGGKSEQSNFICVHTETAREKGEDYPYFTAADKKYEITYLLEEDNWVIAIPSDDESKAEEQAKIDAAMMAWDELFGAESNAVTDFAGREIHKSDYMGQSEYSWKTAPYVEGRAIAGKNLYIASILTVEETLGKTAFKANGKNYTLNKENGAYHFRVIEVKPPKKEYDVKNPYDVAKRISEVSNGCLDGESAMLDFVVIKAVTDVDCTPSNAQAVTDTVNALLLDVNCVPASCEVADVPYGQGKRCIFITMRYVAATPADFERVFNGAQLLNNYATLIMPMLGLSEFKIYNYAEFMSRAHIRCSVAMLGSCYPQFSAFMDSVYKSTEGFYHSEPKSTLYVSNMIIVNIPELLAVHPQETERFYTPVYLAEHNLLDLKMLGTIQEVLAGALDSRYCDESTVAHAETETPQKAPSIEPVSEEMTEAAPTEPLVAETPQGEQLTIAFPPLTDEADALDGDSNGDDLDDGIFTLDLESLD